MTEARRNALAGLLGHPRLHILRTRVQRSECSFISNLYDVTFTFSNGETALAWLAMPDGAGPFPAVLYCHAHGNRYTLGRDELIHGRSSLQGAFGPALASRGFAALCLEMPCFGARQVPDESTRSKAGLWRGQPIFGMMLAELAAALDWLAARPSIDATRIATLGFSMGATQSFWLAALHPRIAAAAHLCCFADLGTLVARGGHDLHGPYMTVPGLLPRFRTGEIAGLIAPRPQFVASGAQDPLTPPEALALGMADLTAAYAATPDSLRHHAEADSGHVETPAMRRAVLAFLAAALGHGAAVAE